MQLFDRSIDPPKLFHYLLQPKPLAILEACVIGLVSALAAVALKQSVEWSGTWRESMADLYPAWLVLPTIGLAGGILAGWLIERTAPETSGSGIPQVKAALAYVPIPLDARVALVKLISTLLSLGSGLTLGRQGPTVQIGAAIAAQLSYWVPTSPDHRRQLIAAGAAAGLAAGFNAPIAGVLFVVEELLQDVSGLTLGTAILASFIGAVTSRILGGRSLNLNLSSDVPFTSFSFQDIPAFIVLGILAGLLGALFCQGIFLSLKFNRQVLRVGLPWRIGIAGWISGMVLAVLPIAIQDNTRLQEFSISDVSWQAIAVVFVVKFLLTLVAFGSGAPGGLFAPSLVLGSALGYLVGVGAQNLQTMSGISFGFGGVDLLTTCALAGMGAFFSAVTRGPITAIVIVFEMTADFNLVLPLMIGSVVAYLVAEGVDSGSIYKRLLALKGIHLQETASADAKLAGLKAADIMQRRVETLSGQMTIDEAVQAFSRSHHRGFPVVNDGKLVGIITQSDLDKVLPRRLEGNDHLSEIMTGQPVTVDPSDRLTQVLYLLNRYKISRLPVTEGRKLVGIITRADIIRAESDQLSGEVDQVGPRPEPSYVVYQTRAPAIGQGRILIPLANPKTAETLLQLGAAIAHDRYYELECLQVIPVSRKTAPAETPVVTTTSRRLLRHAMKVGKLWQIPVHTQVRVTHDTAQAILETLKERHVDLILMGWKGSTSTPGRVFGSAVDTVIRQADCDVVLVKLGERGWTEKQVQPPSIQFSPTASPLAIEELDSSAGSPDVLASHSLDQALPTPASASHPFEAQDPDFDGVEIFPPAEISLSLPRFSRWLVPMAGGPNSQYAVRLLPALSALMENPEIRLCQVFQPSEAAPDVTVLDQAVQFLRRRLTTSVIVSPVCAPSIADAIIDLAEKDQCDVIVLGASREGMLQQAMKGNIPEAIARNCNCTVILVRGAIH